MALSLKHSGLARFFEIVETGFEHGADKPASIAKVLVHWQCKPEEVAYVGDATYDMVAARGAGLVPIAAAWAKTADVDSLMKMAPQFVFQNVDAFAQWILPLDRTNGEFADR